MRKFLTLFMVFGLVACGNKEPKTEVPTPSPSNTPTTTSTTNSAIVTAKQSNTATANATINSVDYYYNNFESMKAKIIDCKSRIVTAQDLEKIKQNEPDCKNAFEAYQKYSAKFNSSENTERRSSTRAFPEKQ